MGKNVWVDAGAHEGLITRHFMKRHGDFVGYAFEPNPNTIPKLPENVELIRKAVWTDDCLMPFYLFSNDKSSEGCTLFREKNNKTLDRDNPITVECVNFGTWLHRLLEPTDYLVLKLDIEGAEYAVLKAMLEDGSIGLINVLYVEWHYKKLPTISKEEHSALKSAVTASVKYVGEYSRIYHL